MDQKIICKTNRKGEVKRASLDYRSRAGLCHWQCLFPASLQPTTTLTFLKSLQPLSLSQRVYNHSHFLKEPTTTLTFTQSLQPLLPSVFSHSDFLKIDHLTFSISWTELKGPILRVPLKENVTQIERSWTCLPLQAEEGITGTEGDGGGGGGRGHEPHHGAAHHQWGAGGRGGWGGWPREKQLPEAETKDASWD